jgi:hypothetical protein
MLLHIQYKNSIRIYRILLNVYPDRLKTNNCAKRTTMWRMTIRLLVTCQKKEVIFIILLYVIPNFL